MLFGNTLEMCSCSELTASELFIKIHSSFGGTVQLLEVPCGLRGREQYCPLLTAVRWRPIVWN